MTGCAECSAEIIGTPGQPGQQSLADASVRRRSLRLAEGNSRVYMRYISRRRRRNQRSG